MSNQNDGGAAFPVAETPESSINTGMTLRDYFAAKAMQSLINYRESFSEAEVATESYKQADAMLSAREEVKQNSKDELIKELTNALADIKADLFYQIESGHSAKAASEYPSIIRANKALSKAKGGVQ